MLTFRRATASRRSDRVITPPGESLSQHLINEYRAELDRLRAVTGSTRETNLRPAFARLLRAWGKQALDLVYVEEHQIRTAMGTLISVDGALVQAFAAGNAKAAEELAAKGDDRALQAPRRVKRYVIKQGDTLPTIAKAEMGSAADAAILEVYNRHVGLLFEDGLLYAGGCLEIPVYDQPAAVPTTSHPAAEGEK